MQMRIGRWISILYRKSQTYIGQRLKAYGIMSSEYPILLQLYDKDGITQDEIVHFHSLDKSGVTRTVQSLEKKGLIFREKDTQDQRCKRIFLTEEGWKAQEIINSVLDEWNQKMEQNFSEEESEEMICYLKKMVENVF